MSICNSLHIELHLTCSIVCCTLPCHASFKPDMHHTCLCIMPCSCLCIYHVVCFFPVLLLSSGNVAIVRIRPTSPVRLLHGPHSSSLRDFRQDDRYPGSHYYHCCASCFVLSLCCATYHLLFKPPKLPCQPLTFSPFLARFQAR